MLFQQRDEMRGRVAGQRRLGKMRIGRKEILGLTVDVRKIAAPAARNENLFAQPVSAFENGDAASALACLDGAHQARCATAENQCVETMGHVGGNSVPQRLNSLLENSRFASGYRFSGAVNAAESVSTSAAAERCRQGPRVFQQAAAPEGVMISQYLRYA